MKIMIKRRGSAYSHRNKVIPYHQGGWRRIHPWGSSLSRRSPYPPCSSRVSGWMRMLRWLRSAPRPRRGVRWRPAVASQSLHPRAELLTARCSSLPPRDTWAWADAERMLNKHPSSLEKTRSFTRTSQTRSWAELSRARSYSICNLKKSTAWSGDSAPLHPAPWERASFTCASLLPAACDASSRAGTWWVIYVRSVRVTLREFLSILLLDSWQKARTRLSLLPRVWQAIVPINQWYRRLQFIDLAPNQKVSSKLELAVNVWTNSLRPPVRCYISTRFLES